jgi:chromosome segregation ATPase
VNRAMQRRDDLRTKVSQAQANQKNLATEVARLEESSATVFDPVQKKTLAQSQENLKSVLVNLKSQELEQENDLQDAEGLLRKEQETLDGIKDQLNEVVKKLQPTSDR